MGRSSSDKACVHVTEMVVANPLFPTVTSALAASSSSSYLKPAQWPIFCLSKRRDSFISAAFLALQKFAHDCAIAWRLKIDGDQGAVL